MVRKERVKSEKRQRRKREKIMLWKRREASGDRTTERGSHGCPFATRAAFGDAVRRAERYRLTERHKFENETALKWSFFLNRFGFGVRFLPKRHGSHHPCLKLVVNMMVNSEKDWTPYMDMEFDTLDEAWEHWCHYGKQVGFSTRKSFLNRSKLDEKVTTRGFVCSKHGVRLEDKRRVHSSHRDETRTNCHARLLVRLKRESVRSAGIKPKDAHELMSREAGGRDSLGYIASDHKTYLRTRREKAMKYGEAGCILMYFQNEQIKNPSFHYVA
ncbi:protein FAR1-RELATED SEQUENCE 5-like [Tripterygium wilfordii]|uniref:protein FAR1-RELATED SEQUENCE 5-like n=1 Tax=Tripterygium wilfordii TaxID=458696 RepID=UPI0018F8303F|nr:protein FAR1-RELATED SEQUENCE 5-like [Tripterygium wilfordii]XP_038713494.1 protein FAR1-RELATED SEQUENCE 5-like [Tripterygium wilfordii]XP_038713496.1 protein FAR1-RELATED SEQUENCE 5-like [Tripterygium wilfordii]